MRLGQTKDEGKEQLNRQVKDFYEQTKEALKQARGSAMTTTKKLEKIVSKDDLKLLERDL